MSQKMVLGGGVVNHNEVFFHPCMVAGMTYALIAIVLSDPTSTNFDSQVSICSLALPVMEKCTYLFLPCMSVHV